MKSSLPWTWELTLKSRGACETLARKGERDETDFLFLANLGNKESGGWWLLYESTRLVPSEAPDIGDLRHKER